MVSGMSPSALWGGLLVADVAIFCVPGTLILMALAWASPTAFGWAHTPLLAAFMVSFALASISQVPPASPPACSPPLPAVVPAPPLCLIDGV